MSTLSRTPDTAHWLPLELYGSRESLYSGTFEGATLFMKENENTKADIRRSMRLARAKLSVKEQKAKAHQMMLIMLQLTQFSESQNIAAYWPNDNEINPFPILTAAYEMGKRCYLPRLLPGPNPQLQFIEYLPGDELEPNRLGILEPVPTNNRKKIAAESLDLVLVPLVAFDKQGHRLGMGKGYYDYTFAFLKRNPHIIKPFLLGVAYDLQSALGLPSDTWDVSIHGVVTETHYIDLKDPYSLDRS